MSTRSDFRDALRLVLWLGLWFAVVGCCMGPVVVQGLARCRGLC